MRGGAARALHAAILLAVMALVTGCATVPTSGPVHEGPVINSGESSQFIRVIAAPPSPGASPVEIVRGFLEANASQQDDWGIARRYLTDGASASWNPRARTRVYDSATLALKGAGQRVAIQAQEVATLGQHGTLDVVLPRRGATQTFHLAAEPGGPTGPQWRITDPEPGVMISLTDLRRGFRLYQAYFFSARATTLVPDARMLPVVGPSLATALTELVLSGPSPWLRRAVRSGVPAGLSLALGAVPVKDGVAVVDLARPALAATPAQRRDLAAQLTWTLTQLPEISEVRMTVESEPFDIPGAPILMDRATWQAVAPDNLLTGPRGDRAPPFYSASGRTLTVVGPEGRSVSDPGLPEGSRVSDLAVSLDRSTIALVTDGRRRLHLLPTSQGVAPRVLGGSGLVAGSFDVDGALWYVDSGRLWRVTASAPPQEVRISSRPAGRLRAVRLARDGARVGVILGDEVYVAAILPGPTRGTGAATVRLGQPRAVQIGLTRITGLAWRDATHLDLLGAADTGGSQVFQLTVGEGTTVAGGAPQRPRSVAAAPLAATLVVTSGGGLFTGVGLQWRGTGSARAAQYPG